ncbi:hypothetical protein ABZ479_23770 [Streptomyces sp. NPDC005722]
MTAQSDPRDLERLEDRLSKALAAHADAITRADLRAAQPPSLARVPWLHRWRPARVAVVVALAAVLTGVCLLAVLKWPQPGAPVVPSRPAVSPTGEPTAPSGSLSPAPVPAPSGSGS